MKKFKRITEGIALILALPFVLTIALPGLEDPVVLIALMIIGLAVALRMWKRDKMKERSE